MSDFIEMESEHKKKISKFKTLGLIANKCKFIVETIATFESNVSKN
jgi:hypothetical protein